VAHQFPHIPILANITEFGVTPLWHKEDLQKAGVKLILYPLSAFRAMSAIATQVYETIRTTGTQAPLLASMQTRADLYEILHYYDYEHQLDKFLQKERKNGQ